MQAGGCKPTGAEHSSLTGRQAAELGKERAVPLYGESGHNTLQPYDLQSDSGDTNLLAFRFIPMRDHIKDLRLIQWHWRRAGAC